MPGGYFDGWQCGTCRFMRGSFPPLFCLHPADGLSWCYSGLLQHIKADYPIYGLQSRSFNQPEIVPRTLQEMVAD